LSKDCLGNNDPFKYQNGAQRRAFSYLAGVGEVPAGKVADRRVADADGCEVQRERCEKRISVFESFPYVCPEPVLAE